NSDGVYVRKPNYGKPEAMGSIAVGAGYKINDGVRIFTNYQFWLQAPFIKQYVPVLPNTALHLGISYPFCAKCKGLGGK
ncbi:MAG: hypothetical protein ACXWDO_11440, partial [Bacteroidia bacterium]